MPKLKNLLNEIGTRKSGRQTPAQMKAALYTLSGQYGIPLRGKD
jgi:hypothetical protein